MAGERNESRGTGAPSPEDEVQSLVRMHQKIAVRLLRDGSPSRAFGELVRASRAAPMSRRLAASLVWLSLRAGTEAAAITLLNAGLEETDGAERNAVRWNLVRLLRRLGELGRAREHLTVLLDEPGNERRARAILNALLEREQRWEELDASLEGEVKHAVAAQALQRAARAALRRARLCQERLGDPARAALRYAQAAQYTEDGGDLEGALNLRMLWLRALKATATPPRALKEATEAFLRLATKVGKEDRARGIARELGLSFSDSASSAPAAAGVGRRATQLALVAAADEAQARGQSAEVAALLSAAVQEGPDPRAQQKLEAHLVARGAWRELAQFYRDAAQKGTREQKVDSLSKLAEVLEDELKDAPAAAKAYGEIVELTGDRRALDEQVRLLSQQEDLSGVRRALDEAVTRARDPAARAQALVARGEAAFARRDLKTARADFDEAVRTLPANVLARAGLAEAAAQLGDRAPVFAFREALSRVQRRQPGRADLLRRLARLAEAPLADGLLARSAWSEVLVESPDDEEAQVRLTALARESRDLVQLEALLRAQLRREPRGPRTRLSRLELVSVLEQKGRPDEALEELRQAVKFEPGHKDAWLALAQRCTARGVNAEAAWALEQAATTTEDDVERQRTWARLADFCQRVLKDEPRARACAARAERLKNDIALAVADRAAQARAKEKERPIVASPIIPAPHGTATEDERTPTQDGMSALPEGESTPSASQLESLGAPAGGESQTQEVPLTDLPAMVSEPAIEAVPTDDVMELTTGDVVPLSEPADLSKIADWVAPPGLPSPRHHTPEVPIAETPPSDPGRVARTQLFAHVRGDPLDPAGYRQLSDHFDHAGDGTRSALMAEIADALAGDPDAAPRPPKLMFSATDRAGMRHPALRTEAGELLGLAGLALCRLFPARGRLAGSRDEFRLDSGRGAQRVADSLLSSVRILGLRSPDVFVSEENGPPFALVYTNGPRMLVGRLAIKKELPEAELRFFAGRALFTQNPDLLALRSLKRDQLARALLVLGSVLVGGRSLSAEARAVRDSLPAKSLPRLNELFGRVGRALVLGPLMEAARHSANRAGLVVCGGVAPALAALRAKKALDSEITELVRFAASERYLQLRSRRLG